MGKENGGKKMSKEMLCNENITCIIKNLKEANKKCFENGDIDCSKVKSGECSCLDAINAQALEELLQYREVGTVDEVRKLKDQLQKLKDRAEDCGLFLE